MTATPGTRYVPKYLRSEAVEGFTFACRDHDTSISDAEGQ